MKETRGSGGSDAIETPKQGGIKNKPKKKKERGENIKNYKKEAMRIQDKQPLNPPRDSSFLVRHTNLPNGLLNVWLWISRWGGEGFSGKSELSRKREEDKVKERGVVS